MKRFLASAFMLMLVLTGAFAPVFGVGMKLVQTKVVYADNHETTTTTTPTDPKKTETEVKDDIRSEQLECGWNVLCAIVSAYSFFIQSLPQFLATVAGMLLDYVVWQNLQSDTFTAQDDVDSFVVKGWKLVRDFSNLLFIFALFTVAFSLILNTNLMGLDPKRTIARVILMALLINFSFTMCRAIIDVTNIFGRVFYEKITVIDKGGENNNQTISTTENGTAQSFGNPSDFYQENMVGIRSVSLGIISKINPQQIIYDTTGGSAFKGESKDFLGIGWTEYDGNVYLLLIFVASMVGIFNFFLIYLFLSSTIFLVSRVYGLFFLIILSPIAFVSTTIPKFQKKEWFGFDDWFEQLVGLAFCLPIYLFFVYLAIFFLKTIGDEADVTTLTGYLAVATTIAARLVAVGAVLIIGKKVAKDMSGKIGAIASGAVTGIVTGAAMVAGAAMTGGASAALRVGGGLARNAVASTAEGVGGAVLGSERVQQMSQYLRSNANGKTMQRLNQFNPIRGMGTAARRGNNQGGLFGGAKGLAIQAVKNFGAAGSEAARFSGSKVPDQVESAYERGRRTGGRSDETLDILRARAESIRRASEEKAKKLKAHDADMEKLAKEYEAGSKTAAEKVAFEAKYKDMAEKRKKIQDGTDTKPIPKQPAPVPQGSDQGGTGVPYVNSQPAVAGPAENPNPTTTAPQNPTTPAPAPATNPAPVVTAPAASPILDHTGRPASDTTFTAAPSRPTVSSSLSRDMTNIAGGPQQNTQLSETETQHILRDIEKDMREIEKDLNNPQTRLNKNREEELEGKYGQLEQERKDVREGRISPAHQQRLSQVNYADTSPVSASITNRGAQPEIAQESFDMTGTLENSGERDFGGVGNSSIHQESIPLDRTESLLSSINSATSERPVDVIGPQDGNFAKKELENLDMSHDNFVNNFYKLPRENRDRIGYDLVKNKQAYKKWLENQI